MELALFARHYLFVAQLETGDVAPAAATLERLRREANDTRLPLYQWETRWLDALLALIGGRFADAERLAGEAVEIGQRAGDPDALSIYGAQIAIVRLEHGRIAELEPAMRA